LRIKPGERPSKCHGEFFEVVTALLSHPIQLHIPKLFRQCRHSVAGLDIANIPEHFSQYRHRVALLDIANIPEHFGQYRHTVALVDIANIAEHFSR
jgi:hypothetical protein